MLPTPGDPPRWESGATDHGLFSPFPHLYVDGNGRDSAMATCWPCMQHIARQGNGWGQGIPVAEWTTTSSSGRWIHIPYLSPNHISNFTLTVLPYIGMQTSAASRADEVVSGAPCLLCRQGICPPTLTEARRFPGTRSRVVVCRLVIGWSESRRQRGLPGDTTVVSLGVTAVFPALRGRSRERKGCQVLMNGTPYRYGVTTSG